jgi:hypothetical protein
MVFEKRVEVIAFGGSVAEGMLSRFGIEKAAHGIELAQIESENFHGMRFLGFGGGSLRLTSPCQHLRSESPDFIRRLPPQTQDLHGFFLCLNICSND